VLTALTQAPLGIAIFDREMRYLAASTQYRTDQGLAADTPLDGRLHYDVFPGIPQKWRDIHARALADGLERSHDADPWERADGTMEWIRWSIGPWRTEDGEIGGLVLYTEDVTPRVKAQRKLEAAEAQYRAVFDQAAMGVARVSPAGRLLEVNDRFCAIVHHSRDDLLALGFQEITHPDDLENDLVQASALLAGQVETYSMEKRYLGGVGEVIWADLTVSLVRDADGQPAYFVAIIEDINARKEAQAEQQRYQGQLRLVLNELNHRVKNTLATVQSMAAQTMRGERDPRVAFEKFEARLMGLSQVHDVLTRESWHGAALEEVAERAMQPFAGQASGRVSVSGPPVRLQPGAALNLALVFHELATNAVKYGALSTAQGQVSLTWALDATGERLALTWAESGGPPVKAPTRKGFGSRLIQQGLKGELRGSATMRYEPDGLVCAMEARIPTNPPPPALFGGD